MPFGQNVFDAIFLTVQKFK